MVIVNAQKKEETLSNQLYEVMLETKKPKLTKYNKTNIITTERSDPFTQARSSASSGCCSSVASSANKQHNKTLWEVVEKLRTEQEIQRDRLDTIESKVETIQTSMKTSVIEALMEFHSKKG